MSIYRRAGSEYWYVCISVAGRKTRRSTGTADRAQAKEFEKAERERLWRLHKLGDRGALRFAEAAAEWLEGIPKATRSKEEGIADWFIGQIGDEPISSIDKAAALELRTTLVEVGRSRARADRMLGTFRAILSKAVENNHLALAPEVPLFNDEFNDEDFRWLRHHELDLLCAQLPQHLALAARFACYTGLRMRAQLGLLWSRVDLDKRRFWVPAKQMKGKRRRKKALGLWITDELLDLFRQLRELSPHGDHVFQYGDNPIDDCNTEAFKKAVKRAALDPLRWHDFRHTFASWAIQNGVTLPELMQLGGWRSIASVMRYAHLAPDHLQQAAEKISKSGPKPALEGTQVVHSGAAA